MRLHTKTTQFILAAFLFSTSFACFAQDQNASQPKPAFPRRAISPSRTITSRTIPTVSTEAMPDRSRVRSVSRREPAL